MILLSLSGIRHPASGISKRIDKMDKNQKSKKIKKKKTGFREYSESLFVALAIALVIRALVIYPFKIPTGSMEDSLLIGDFLLANKFVYGIRSPDWIGIPYTKIGFKIPFFRTPGFRKPARGDVVIFKYPRDDTLNYIKRCVAVSGDTLEVIDNTVYVNGDPFQNAPKTKFLYDRVIPKGVRSPDIFPPGAGNIHNYGPIRIPAPGDTLRFTDNNKDRWFEWFQLIVYAGRKLVVTHGGESMRLTIENQNRWERAIRMYDLDDFSINGESLEDLPYIVKNRHYFMMGDNRDNSLDSRYWGFLPERYVVGEGLIIYWSWDKEVPMYRLFKKIRFNRILDLIR